MDMLIKLGIYLAIVAALTGAKLAYDLHQRGIGYDKAVAEYTPKVTAERNAKQTALDANVSLQADLTALRKLLQESNDRVGQLAKEDEQRSTAARAILLSAAAKLKNSMAEVARLRAIAASPTISKDDCNEAFGIIDGVLTGRLRDAGSTASDGKSRATAAGQDSGSGVVPGREGRTDPTRADPRDSGHGIEETKGGGDRR